MALPATFPTGFGENGTNTRGRLHPFKSSGGDYYVLGLVDQTTYVDVMATKSADPTTANFTEQDSSNRPTNNGASGAPDAAAIYSWQDGPDIHCIFAHDQSGETTPYYCVFDTSTDTWTEITTSATEDSIPTPNLAGPVGLHIGYTRSDGDIAAFVEGQPESNMGTDYGRIAMWESVDGGVNWTEVGYVHANGKDVVENFYLGATGLSDDTGTVDYGYILTRTSLSSPDNVEMTTINNTGTIGTLRTYAIDPTNLTDGMVFDRSGSGEFRASVIEGGAHKVLDAPVSTDITTFSEQTVGGDNNSVTTFDESDGTQYAIVRNSGNLDLRDDQATDTWTATASSVVTTTGGSAYPKGATVYTNDAGDTVIGIVYYDAGTYKYDEYTLSSGVTYWNMNADLDATSTPAATLDTHPGFNAIKSASGDISGWIYKERSMDAALSGTSALAAALDAYIGFNAIMTGASENLVLDSNDPTTGNWAVTLLTNTQDQPDIYGNANVAWSMTDAEFVTNSNIAQSVPVDGPVIVSCYVQKNSSPDCYCNLQYGGHGIQVDPADGTVGTASGTSAPDASGAIDLPGYYRIWMRVDGPFNSIFNFYPAWSETMGGSGSNSLGTTVAYGWQVEEIAGASGPSPYKETGSSPSSTSVWVSLLNKVANIDGVLAGTSTQAADLDTQTSFAAALLSTTSLSGTLDTQPGFDSALAVTSALASELDTYPGLAAAITAAATLAAELDRNAPPADFNAIISATSALAAELDAYPGFAAAIAAAAVMASELDTQAGFDAIMAGLTAGDASLDTQASFDAAFAATSTLDASLNNITSIDAAMSALSNLAAALDAYPGFAAAINAASTMDAALDAYPGLAAALAAAAAGAAELDRQAAAPDVDMDAILAGNAALAAVLDTHPGLAAAVAASGDLAAALDSYPGLAAALAASGDLAGTLDTQTGFNAVVASTSAVAGLLDSYPGLAATLAATGDLAAAMDTYSGFAAGIAASSTLDAALDTHPGLAAAVAAVSGGTGELDPQSAAFNELAAAIVGTSTLAAALDAQPGFDSVMQATAAFAGEVDTQPGLTGALLSTAAVAANLDRGRYISAVLTGTAALAAELDGRKSFASIIAATTTLDADLDARPSFAADIAGLAALAAELEGGSVLDTRGYLDTEDFALYHLVVADNANYFLSVTDA